MEEELDQLKKEETVRAKILMDLGSQRDRVALSIANKLAKVKEVEALARIKVGRQCAPVLTDRLLLFNSSCHSPS